MMKSLNCTIKQIVLNSLMYRYYLADWRDKQLSFEWGLIHVTVEKVNTPVAHDVPDPFHCFHLFHPPPLALHCAQSSAPL